MTFSSTKQNKILTVVVGGVCRNAAHGDVIAGLFPESRHLHKKLTTDQAASTKWIPNTAKRRRCKPLPSRSHRAQLAQ